MATKTQSNAAKGGEIPRESQELKALSGGSVPMAVAPTQSAGNTSRQSRPRKVEDHYPVRSVTWYQVSAGEIKEMGAANWLMTISAALGTFSVSWYVDFSKELALAVASSQPTPMLQAVANLMFWASLLFWGMTIFGFLWRVKTWGRVKEEHGELPWWRKVRISGKKQR